MSWLLLSYYTRVELFELRYMRPSQGREENSLSPARIRQPGGALFLPFVILYFFVALSLG